MKYQIDDKIIINNIEWIIDEYKMGRGREWKYTLSHKDNEGNYITMSLNERAMDGITLSNKLMGSNK